MNLVLTVLLVIVLVLLCVWLFNAIDDDALGTLNQTIAAAVHRE